MGPPAGRLACLSGMKLGVASKQGRKETQGGAGESRQDLCPALGVRLKGSFDSQGKSLLSVPGWGVARRGLSFPSCAMTGETGRGSLLGCGGNSSCVLLCDYGGVPALVW